MKRQFIVLILVHAGITSVHAQQLKNKSPGAPSRASEDIGKCDSVLVPDVTVIQSNLTVKASFLRIIDETNYQQYKQQYSATFPEYFSGDYSQFEEARRHYYELEQYNLEIYEAKSILQSVVSTEKVNAWLQCVTSTGSGIFAYINDANDVGATLKLQWVPPAGLGKLKKPILTLDQATSLKPNNFESQKEFVGTAEIILRRTINGEWVRGVASGTSGNSGSYSSRFFIPHVPKPYIVKVDENAPSSMSFETRFLVPAAPLPKDVNLKLDITTTQTGEYFTQCCRFIQQYVWVGGALKFDSGEVKDFGEGQVRVMSHSENVIVPAGHQVEVKVRNNGKGAKMGQTTLHWSGQYEVMK